MQPQELLEEGSAAELRAALSQLTHVRLDRERLISLGDSLAPPLGASVTNLYLQCNRLESMEAVAALPALRFLTLASNRLTRVQGVAGLANLLFLDGARLPLGPRRLFCPVLLSHISLCTAAGKHPPASLLSLRQ